MSASDEIWILGIRMTKFGKHPDKDTVDLAAEAARPRTDHRGSAEYKRHMVRTFVARLLNRAEPAAERAA